MRISEAAVSHDGRTVWSGVNLSVWAGEVVALVGPAGCGKSMLVRAILGLQPLSSGALEVLGQPAVQGDRRVGYLPQEEWVSVGTPMSGRDVVGLGLRGHRLRGRFATGGTRRQRVDGVIAAVGGQEFASRGIGHLTASQRQRVALACALVGEPSVIVCDEPMAALWPDHQRNARRLLAEYRQSHQAAVLIATQNLDSIRAITDRALCFRGGRLIGSASSAKCRPASRV